MSKHFMSNEDALQVLGTYAEEINRTKPIEITYENYLALSETDKNTHRYIITDYPGRDVSGSDPSKADKVVNATNGHLAALDANGNLLDSGIAPGTAAGKDSTANVAPNNHDLVESASVYHAINTALSSVYHPRGELTCAELTSSLLVAANVGNIYEMSDAGTTTALFLQGAGQPIAIGDNVGIIQVGDSAYKFNLMANAFDLHDYQKKELTAPVAGGTTVEGALGALNTNKAEQAEVNDIVNVLGAKNLLLLNTSHIRRINAGGTWSNNSYTYNGITYTLNNDGSVLVNGTASDYSIFRIVDNSSIEFNPDSNKTYYYSGTPSSGSSFSTYYSYYSEYVDGSWAYKIDYGSGVSVTPNASATQIVVDIVVKGGQSISNQIFKPMLRLASDPDSTYAPYAMTNQQMTPYVQTISNLNLLDNAWFTINQRGLSSYPHTSGKQYTVDRWFENAHASVTVSSSGITITSDETGSNSDLGQNTEGLYDLVAGKIVTASVMMSNGKIYHGSGFIPSVYTVGAIRFDLENGYKCDINVNPQSANYALQFFMYSGTNNPNKSISVRACKLELGPVSTLAMDTRPNYQQELAKCQRYYIGGVMESMYLAKAGNYYICFVPTPVTMRAIPSIVGEPSAYSVSSNTKKADAVISLFGSAAMANGVALQIGGVTEPCIVVFSSTSMGLSAEL